MFDQALTRLWEEYAVAGKSEQFNALKGFLENETNSGDYTAVSAQLKMNPAAVAVAVSRLRQRYRDLLISEIAQTVANEAEIEDEMRYLFESLNAIP